MDARDESSFLAAVRVASDLAVRPEVADRWDQESACPGMSVGGLACHLASQADNTVRVLGAGASGQAPIAVPDHYGRAAWVNSDLDDEANAGIREGSNAQAAGGPGELRDLVGRRLEQLPAVLAGVGSDDPVLIPWQGWSLTAHDFLVTRMMEIVVHADDLAVSIGVATPEFPAGVTEPVLALLTGLAVRRHGQAAVVRTLTRPQRAPGSVSAF